MNNSLIDSHCHLDFDSLYAHLPSILGRAKMEGVSGMLTIATNFRDIERTISICENYHHIYFATGVHPNQHPEKLTFDNKDLLEICSHKKMIGIGETGLDLHYSNHTKKDQTKSLIKHIEIAKETNLPIIIHSRNADEEIKKILFQQYKISPFKCVMHCFSSGSYLAEALTELDFYFSMSGIITFKNADPLRRIFSKLPIEKILVETDSPYLSPVPYRGKKNEPAFVSSVAKKGAELFDLDEDVFRNQTTNNFFSLFSKATNI